MARLFLHVSGGDDNSEESRKVSAKKERTASGLILQPRERKEKKEKKEKEQARYAHLGDDSSGDDDADGKSPAKSKRSKAAFMFSSAKKDKEKKSFSTRDPSVDAGASGDALSSHVQSAITASGKKKDKKEKPKLKLITKHKHHHADSDDAKTKVVEENFPPIFGVPLAVATERNRSHDGVPLPVIVRQCIDYVEDQGLMQEGIYRSSGVKSKVNKLRAAFNSRQQPNLLDYEPAVVTSVLKQFLRELPDPVLTKELMPRFEAVSADPTPQKRIEGMKHLINSELPECNRCLVQWIFVHMMHVIERERFNKMTLQNVSIVLSPTMQISHRVLSCLFENSHILFGAVQLKRYVPPITGDGAGSQDRPLPDSPADIEEEIRKQESLLSDLHLQISSGAASKKVEEQVWEQQRIVTQLKRKLRMAKQQSEGQLNLASGVTGGAGDAKPKFEPIDYEENLNFELQQPKKTEDVASKPTSKEHSPPEKRPEELKAPAETGQRALEQRRRQEKEEQHHLQQQQQQQLRSNKDSPPEETAKTETEHKVTVMIHQSEKDGKPRQQQHPAHVSTDAVDAKPHVTVIKLQETEKEAPTAKESSPTKEAPSASPTKEESPTSSSKKGSFPLLPPPPASHKMRQGNAILLRPTPASPMHTKPQQQHQPPPPQQQFHSSLSVDRGVDLAKSKSLPRGLPSDGSAFDMFAAEEAAAKAAPPSGPLSLNPFPSEEQLRKEQKEQEIKEHEINELLLEEARARFEFEELSILKSELVRRKEAERKEMDELREELASMQTLYQYRTCSVDSSESSSDEAEEGKESTRESTREEEVEELTRVLKDLTRENTELQEKKQELCQKIQEERAACVELRVEIRVEQERRKMVEQRKQERKKRNGDLLMHGRR